MPEQQPGEQLTSGAVFPPSLSCPVPNTYTSVIQNGNSSKAQFKLRIFSFVNNSIVYLHCKLRVCMENPRNSCRIVSAGSFLLPPCGGGGTHDLQQLGEEKVYFSL